jgi:hypothetical protein
MTGQAPVRIDGEKFRRAGTRVADLDRQVLVVEPDLHGDPERAERARARDAVNAQAGHVFFPSRRVCDEHTRHSPRRRIRRASRTGENPLADVDLTVPVPFNVR